MLFFKKPFFMLAKDQALVWACNKKKFKIFMQQCPKYFLIKTHNELKGTGIFNWNLSY